MIYETETTVNVTMTIQEAKILKNMLQVVDTNLQGMLLNTEKQVLGDFKDTLQEATQ